MINTTLTIRSDKAWSIDGELTFVTVSNLLAQSKKLWKDTVDIDVDFSKVTQSDSASLALLLEWQRYANKEKKQISFANLPKQLLNLIQISELNEMFVIK